MSQHWLRSCLTLFALSFGVRFLAQIWTVGTLSFDTTQWLSQPWTWWTAPLLTPNFGLWVAQLACLLLVGIWGHALGANRSDAICLWLCWPLSSLGLLLWPMPLVDVSGLSGLAHAAGAILLVRLSLQTHRQWLSTLAIALFAFKLGLEHAWISPHAFSADWGAHFWPALNASGAIAGVLTAQVALRWKPASQ